MVFNTAMGARQAKAMRIERILRNTSATRDALIVFREVPSTKDNRDTVYPRRDEETVYWARSRSAVTETPFRPRKTTYRDIEKSPTDT